jgi:hypothetical protein
MTHVFLMVPGIGNGTIFWLGSAALDTTADATGIGEAAARLGEGAEAATSAL